MAINAKVRPFISYAREDVSHAKKLLSDLRLAGIEPWIDIEHLQGGQDWEREVRHALKDATHVIAVLSARSVNKRGFIQKELRYALDQLQEFPPGDIFLVPVRLDETQPRHDELLKLHWIDLFPNYYDGLTRLVRSLQLTLPPLQYLSVHTHYEIADPDGELAHVRNIQIVQAHVEGVCTFLTRGIAGAGQVAHVTSNLGRVKVHNEGGVTSATTHLPQPLAVREPAEHVLSYDGIRCFTSPAETVAQNIAHRLHNSGVHIRVPAERPLKEVTGYIAYGEMTDWSPQVAVSSDRLRASLTIEYPVVGARLVLKWEW